MGVFVDSPFLAPDGTVISAYASPDGTVWTKSAISGAGDAVTTNSQVFGNGTDLDNYYSAGGGHTPPSADCSVEACFTSFCAPGDTGNNGQGFLFLRQSSGGNNSVYAVYTPNDFNNSNQGTWQIQQLLAGVNSNIALLVQPFGSITTPQTRFPRLEAIGSTVNLYIDGALALTGVTTVVTTGFAGFAVAGGGVNKGVGVRRVIAQTLPVAATVFQALPNAAFPMFEWDESGVSGAFIQTGAGAARITFKVLGATCVWLRFITSAWSDGSVHRFVVWVDGVRQPGYVGVIKGDTNVCFARNISTAAHTIDIMQSDGQNGTDDRWDPAAVVNQFLRVDRIGVDAGTISPMPAPCMTFNTPAKALLFLGVGDSLTEYAPRYLAFSNDATQSYIRLYCEAMGWRYAISAHSGLGIITQNDAASNVPPWDATQSGGANTSFLFIDKLTAISPAKLAQIDVFGVFLATNDAAGNQATLATSVATAIIALRAAMPKAVLLFGTSYSQATLQANATIAAQVAAYKVAHPSDTKVFCFTPPEYLPILFAAASSGINPHYDMGAHAMQASDLLQQSRAQGVPAGTGSSGGSGTVDGFGRPFLNPTRY